MRVTLAEQLLAKIMKWSPEEVSNERPLLQALANFKYDEYQQFSPGIRFIESLAQWLNQFKEKEEKDIAYNFIKKQLIFISNNQLSHLVNLSFTTYIRPIIIRKVAEKLKVDEYLIQKITNSKEYRKVLRQSLFIGLSDGSRIDQLRRYAQLDNEQVLTTYYIDNEKIKDLQGELVSSCDEKKFSSIFLIDDFTASGTSYARFEEEKAKGKILKLLNKIYADQEENDRIQSLVEKENLSIHIIFYIATDIAIENIRSAIEKYIKAKAINIYFTIDVIQLISKKIKENVLNDIGFISLIKQDSYFDKSIEDKHFLKGLKNGESHLGFAECALPLVLFHNTPNNSIPLIWFSEDNKIKGLFPRITRHKE